VSIDIQRKRDDQREEDGVARFEGREHIPEIGPVLVVCNHISYLDTIYTGVFMHRSGRFRLLPRTEVIVRAGPAIDLSDVRRRPVDGILLREATDRVRGGVRDLLAEVREKPAPPEFFDSGEHREQTS
jgi:putative hemolysin